MGYLGKYWNIAQSTDNSYYVVWRSFGEADAFVAEEKYKNNSFPRNCGLQAASPFEAV
jgi:hypothetical protein